MRIALFGGSGFIGRQLAAQLACRGHSLVIPVRHREHIKGDLILLPDTDVYAYNPHSAATMTAALQNTDTVINLVGILHQSKQQFESVHSEFTRVLTSCCANHKVKHFIQVSAIGASSTAPSAYLNSKAKAEEIVRGHHDFSHTIVRPSVVFGAGDRFACLFAKLMRWSPIFPVPGATAKMQPIAIENLITLLANVAEKQEYYQQTLHAGGPRVMTLLEIVQTIQKVLGLKRLNIPLGENASYAFAAIAEKIPFFNLISRDNCLSMKIPSVCPKKGNDAEISGEKLIDLESGLIQIFGNPKKFDHYRLSARR